MYAGFWKRFVAYFVDGIILAILGFGLTLGVPEQANLISLVVFLLYFSLMESSPMQATLGKKLMGIKVTDMQGQRLSFVKALLRTLCKFISYFTMSIGFIMAGLTQKKQTLHDLITGALVVNEGFSPEAPAGQPQQNNSTAVIIVIAVCAFFFIVFLGGCIAAIAFPQYFKAVEKSRAAEALVILKSVSDSANRYYLAKGTYSGIDIGPAGNLDIDPPAGNTGFGFALGSCRGRDCIISACRKAEKSTPDASACANPKYTISYNLSNGKILSKACVPAERNSFCSGLSEMFD